MDCDVFLALSAVNDLFFGLVVDIQPADLTAKFKEILVVLQNILFGLLERFSGAILHFSIDRNHLWELAHQRRLQGDGFLSEGRS